jgi:uncharacterized phage protein gp47/JayE
MAFARPTLQQLYSRILGDLEAESGAAGNILRLAMLRIFAAVFAGVAHMLYGFLSWVLKQLFADKSDDEYLTRQLGLHGVTKAPPGYARATVEFSGNGATVPIGAILTRGDGREYELLANVVTIDGTPVEGEVLAVEPGADGSVLLAMVLTLQSPVAGVTSTAPVTEVLVDGTDVESTETFRARGLAYLASPPQGGNENDFIGWIRAVAGVTRAWVQKWGLGPGTVVCRFARDNDLSPIPDAGEIAQVQTALDELGPVAAGITVAALVGLPINFDIDLVPDTPQVRASVRARLQARLRRRGPGADIPVSVWLGAIGSAAGLEEFELNSPSALVAVADNQLPVLGTIASSGVPW